MASKIHYKITACTKAARTTDNVNQVTCGRCVKQPVFKQAQGEALAKEAETFLAQEPRPVQEPWRDGTMLCSECGGTLFRIGNRTCHGHYQDYHCANPACSHVESRLTETGMSF